MTEAKEKELSIWDHLAELARRVKIIIYALVISTIAMMVLPSNMNFISDPLQFYDPLVGALLRRIKDDVLPQGVTLAGFSLTTPMELYLWAAFIFALIICTPVIAYEVFKFVSPALYSHEKKFIYPFIGSITLLFAVGALFSYFILTPFMIKALLPFFGAVGATPLVEVKDFYTLVFAMVITCGAMFTFPVFYVMLVRFGVLGTAFLRRNRKYVWAGTFVVTAVMTPDGGPLADLMLFVPIIFLLEMAILIGRRFEKKRQTKS